jgi:hypothetical protein
MFYSHRYLETMEYDHRSTWQKTEKRATDFSAEENNRGGPAIETDLARLQNTWIEAHLASLVECQLSSVCPIIN